MSVQNTSVMSMEASVQHSDSLRTEAVVADEDKKTPENSVPNIIITCTVDDDLQSATNALQMIDAFNLPTVNEVFFSH